MCEISRRLLRAGLVSLGRLKNRPFFCDFCYFRWLLFGHLDGHCGLFFLHISPHGAAPRTANDRADCALTGADCAKRWVNRRVLTKGIRLSCGQKLTLLPASKRNGKRYLTSQNFSLSAASENPPERKYLFYRKKNLRRFPESSPNCGKGIAVRERRKAQFMIDTKFVFCAIASRCDTKLKFCAITAGVVGGGLVGFSRVFRLPPSGKMELEVPCPWRGRTLESAPWCGGRVPPRIEKGRTLLYRE